MNRGDQREAVFRDDENRRGCLSAPGELCRETDVRAARRLREETTVSLKWIAARLHMGGWTHVSNLPNEKPETPPTQRSLLWCQ
jgi:hypothetical protein